ncbi:MAG: hypothetical protein EXR47_06465 [Dehalococcoidia bacterium]|nr:hypothetical protein [Dehalococcoidia bacterium]
MGEKILVQNDGQATLLEEAPSNKEVQLQDLINNNPNLLPLEELGLDGPLLIVGLEAPLSAGKADLIALAKSGELVLVEFKTGT